MPRSPGTAVPAQVVDQMQTRAELYATIGLHDYEALDASIIQTIVPEGMPRR